MIETAARPTPTSNKPKPSGNGRRALGAVVGLVVVAVVAAAWWLGLFTPEPEAVSLEATVAAAQAEDSTTSEPGSETASEAGDRSTEDETTAEASDLPATSGLAGTWTVVTGDATFVGYRADSQVGEAVGRSPGVVGTLEASDDQILSVTVIGDMTQLTSDSSVRDDHLGDDGIEHETFPTSTFVLTQPINIDTVPNDGVAVAFDAVGELTVRDITQPVIIALEGTIIDGNLIVAGSAEISLEDFGASISSTTEATMEFSLVFQR